MLKLPIFLFLSFPKLFNTNSYVNLLCPSQWCKNLKITNICLKLLYFPILQLKIQIDRLFFFWHFQSFCSSKRQTDGWLDKTVCNLYVLVTFNCLRSTGNWVSLEYEGGQGYGHHCASEGRRTILMMTCNPSESEVSVALKSLKLHARFGITRIMTLIST